MSVYLVLPRWRAFFHRAKPSYAARVPRSAEHCSAMSRRRFQTQKCTPQPVVLLQIRTTSFLLILFVRYRAEKKNYPVPGGTKRYQPVRSGTTGNFCRLHPPARRMPGRAGTPCPPFVRNSAFRNRYSLIHILDCLSLHFTNATDNITNPVSVKWSRRTVVAQFESDKFSDQFVVFTTQAHRG